VSRGLDVAQLGGIDDRQEAGDAAVLHVEDDDEEGPALAAHDDARLAVDRAPVD
jgi:hypothetical protein